MDELIKLGGNIKTKRKNKGISLNKMSKDLYGNRYRVNHLSNIEQGKVDISYTQFILIKKYLNF